MGDEDESERMDDPTMPQILCVTGGALEEREEVEDEKVEAERGEGGGLLQEEPGPWEQGANETEMKTTSEEYATSKNQQESGDEPAQQTSVSDNQPSSCQEEQLTAVQEGDEAVSDPKISADQNAKEPEEETDAEKKDKIKAEQLETEGGASRESDEDEGKGVKRKREEAHREDEARHSNGKKKLDDDAMASMLADFVACPPDDEDGASRSNCS